MLTLHVPPGRAAARQWIAGVVLGEFLGLDWQCVAEARDDVALTLAGQPGVLRMPDRFLSQSDAVWLTPASLPVLPLPTIALTPALAARAGADTLPVLFGDPQQPADPDGLAADNAWLGIDVFGTAFFLLSRYEELVADRALLDEHGRYPARTSLLARLGVLHRPLADECVEYLREAMTRLWPGLACKPPAFRVSVSCDVDRPFDDRLRAWDLVARDLVYSARDGDFRAVVARWRERLAFLRGGDAADPNFAFDVYLDACEARGLQATFYMLAGGSTRLDATYRIDDPRIVALMRRIHQRGHAIGLHGSYATIDDPALLAGEAARLRDVLATAGIGAEVREGRQHYLRWDAAGSWRAAAAAGLACDSSLGFAEQPGFRCGTCREYGVFDVRRDEPLPLRERPLVLMDVTLLSPRYASVAAAGAAAVVRQLAASCRAYGGNFTLLWHNNGIGRPATAALFARTLDAALETSP